MRILSPAKVNIGLEILGKREDGFHDIKTLMVPITLCDEIILAEKDSGIKLRCSCPEIPDGSENIAYKAASLFLERTGIRKGIHVDIIKSIPHGAGLGGGSSNGASVLRAMNEINGSPLSEEELLGIAGEIGSDVPFFIKGKPAFVYGRGEIVVPIDDFPKVWFLLIKPPISISTKWAYEQVSLKLTNRKKGINIANSGNKLELKGDFYNDFESIIIKRYPVLKDVKRIIRHTEPEGIGMSGKGPTFFGIFMDEQRARKAYELIKVPRGWMVTLVHSL